MIAGPAIERYGHRHVFWGLSIVSFIGIISKCCDSDLGLLTSLAELTVWFLVEITAADTGPGTGRLAQFIAGRIIVYISVGLVEVDVT